MRAVIIVFFMASPVDDFVMQTRDCVKRREDRAFLPCRQIGKMLTGADHAVVDLDRILVIVAVLLDS